MTRMVFVREAVRIQRRHENQCMSIERDNLAM